MGLHELLTKLFALWAELNTDAALTTRPPQLYGRFSLKTARQALSFEEWYKRSYDKQSSSSFKTELNFDIADLRSVVSEFVWSWSDYCAELLGLPDSWALPRPVFLLQRSSDIEALDVVQDFKLEAEALIKHIERALGHGEYGILCSCGKGRMLRDDFGAYSCSACKQVFSAAEIKDELKKCVTLRQASDILNVKEGTLRQRVSRHNIVAINDEKPFIYRLSDLTK